MRLPSRQLQIFSLSALDVLAMACGVFVLLLVLMMPYYRRTLDAAAAVQAIRASAATVAAEIPDVEAETVRLRGRAEELLAEAARLEGETRRLLAAARAAADNPRPAAPARPQAVGDVTPSTVRELDLVFVVDTTASMEPVLRELAAAMGAIVRVLRRLVPSVRVGIAAYSDSDTGRPPPPSLPLTAADEAGSARIADFLEGLSAATVGSRTTDEDLHVGVETALGMVFRGGARQALVVVTDAPAHDWAMPRVLGRTRAFVLGAPGRTVSTLFVWTPGSRQNEAGARAFLRQVAVAGRGSYSEHVGGLIENVLLSVLTE